LCFCAFGQSEYFANEGAVRLVLEQFLRAAREQAFAILAYCFMPDHVHLLIEGETDASDCRAFIARAKQYSAYYFKRRAGMPLWQRYGHEHVLRSDQATLAVARYIVGNPLRAGLVDRIEEYPFFGSSRYSKEELIKGTAWSG